MKHILVVDDDAEIAQLITIYLRNEGFKVSGAMNGREALKYMEEMNNDPIHMMILDIMMPEMDGLEVCRHVREKYTIPILMLSAKTQDMDKILGLMTGADDYMIKPFNPLELLARVKSLLRRSFQFNPEPSAVTTDDEMIKLSDLTINKTSHRVTAHGKELTLTSTEFDILFLLARTPGRVFSAEEMFQLVWKEKYYASNNTVMVHISRLRDKLEKALGYKLIQTVWGVGYKIES
ncbi:response regulator transcription factor [Marinicrinis lubricantis]|uniref:Response regulator transcription factor n=1 Tax=Marinicrinis lubricantis TaxID=2086470 RepID=A0ABW1IKD3_9BACL